jgi:hypothetical protein
MASMPASYLSTTIMQNEDCLSIEISTYKTRLML